MLTRLKRHRVLRFGSFHIVLGGTDASVYPPMSPYWINTRCRPPRPPRPPQQRLPHRHTTNGKHTQRVHPGESCGQDEPMNWD
jgi:hypothetical protein